MAPIELDATCDLDVTIFFVENLSLEQPEAGSPSNKKRRTSMQEFESSTHGAPPLGQVKVKASRLRRCSTYFDTCMSERWAHQSDNLMTRNNSQKMELHLEVHTDVSYYEDCFSRMNYLFKPITSVASCIELLKVASQIGFQALVDLGVQCLGGTAWSEEDEKLVNKFCTTSAPHLVSLDSLADLLSARFHHLPSAQEELSVNAKHMLRSYLRNALVRVQPETFMKPGAALKRQLSNRKKFALAFNVVMMSGRESSTRVVCDEVREHMQSLLSTELAHLLTRVQGELTALPTRAYAIERLVSDMCWLFQMAQEATATQELLLTLLLGNNLGFSGMLYFSVHKSHPCPVRIWHVKQWAKIIHSLFQDVLAGKLFLNSLQRSTLFRHWGWLVDRSLLDLDSENVKAFNVRFVTTLPQADQERFWMRVTIEPERGIYWEAHKRWISRMVSRKGQVVQPQATALSNEEGSASSSWGDRGYNALDVNESGKTNFP